MASSRLAALGFVLALGLSACSSDDLDPGHIELSWSFEDIDTGEPLGCAPGDEIVVVVEDVVISFDCDDGGGITPALLPGRYLVTIEAVDTFGDLLAAITLTVEVFDGAVTDVGHIVFPVE